MPITDTERTLLRDLAKQVAEIGAHPRQAVQREMWKRHNGLRPGKPMVLVFPEGAWTELLPDDTLAITDPFFRRWEWHLRHIIYRWQHLRDDNVIEPVLKVGPGAHQQRLGARGRRTSPAPRPAAPGTSIRPSRTPPTSPSSSSRASRWTRSRPAATSR